MSFKLDSAQNCPRTFLFLTHNKEMCTFFLYWSNSLLNSEWFGNRVALKPFHCCQTFSFWPVFPPLYHHAFFSWGKLHYQLIKANNRQVNASRHLLSSFIVVFFPFGKPISDEVDKSGGAWWLASDCGVVAAAWDFGTSSLHAHSPLLVVSLIQVWQNPKWRVQMYLQGVSCDPLFGCECTAGRPWMVIYNKNIDQAFSVQLCIISLKSHKICIITLDHSDCSSEV